MQAGKRCTPRTFVRGNLFVRRINQITLLYYFIRQHRHDTDHADIGKHRDRQTNPNKQHHDDRMVESGMLLYKFMFKKSNCGKKNENALNNDSSMHVPATFYSVINIFAQICG